MTVPGVEGQSAMLRKPTRDADIEPSHVTYMEASADYGTPVGDHDRSCRAGNVLCEGRAKDNKCLIGSVKTNIGHLRNPESGIAGFVKAVLVLHHDTVPPNRNFQTPNPTIPFERLGLEVARELQPLPHIDGVTPVVAVNSFGFGGTNAHVVLESAPPIECRSPAKSRRVKGFNGSTTERLAEMDVILPKEPIAPCCSRSLHATKYR